MNKKAIAAVSILAATFIALNLFLIFKDDNKIKRTSYLNKWQAAKKQTLRKELPASGVVIPEEEQYVHHDPKKGTFQKFLVKKGDQVTAGTPLYTFVPQDHEELQQQLESQKSAAEGELQSIKEHIDSLTSYKSSLETSSTDTYAAAADPAAKDQTSPNDLKIFELEKDLYSLEADQSRMQARVSAIDSQLSSLSTDSSEVSVESEVDGYVSDIKQSLKNPLITISSIKTAVAGSLSEKNRQDVKEGMEVRILSQRGNHESAGEITAASNFPEKKPEVKSKSSYAFQTSIAKQKPFALAGSHVDVQIITKEAKGAVVVPEEALLKEKERYYVFALGSDGLLHKRQVEPGFTVDGKREIRSGLKSGDAAASNYKEVVENKGPFFTQLHAEDLQASRLKKLLEGKKWLLSFFSGVKNG
ncbi:efflux RND transporter periplasmic adaptor subunit [Peribacillus kribbensis]|uniref:efflux RND transporter periplasmic adaptor subunit n=1 Tax=Peribacillus kribbensis TaxID=356658 RepID=UPI00040FAF7A|nr:hypothetical protein [Peribacillus kribbensis]